MNSSADAFFPSVGSSEEQVMRELASLLEGDLTFSGDSILGSMCTLPLDTAARVFSAYLDRNIGDPGLHPGLDRLERETIRLLGSILGSPEAAGAIVTGGTEANLIALWAAKRRGGGKRKVVLPESSHFSFDKAADLMDLELRKVRVGDDGRVDLERYLAEIDGSVMALVAVAGTTGLGAVDPVPEIAEAALAASLPLHVDAAFGGFVLPFLAGAGYPSPPFDFSLKGVTSITLDPHKMGRCPIPAGAVLFRDNESAEASETKVTYLSGGETRQRTIVGTRSGASVAAVWAAIRRLGKEGYTASVKSCMDLTVSLYRRLLEMRGLEPVIAPEMNVVGIRPLQGSGCDAPALAKALRARGWALSLFPGFLRITVMPHVTAAMLDDFLFDLEEILS